MEVSYQTRRADAWRAALFLVLGNGKIVATLLGLCLLIWLFGQTLFGVRGTRAVGLALEMVLLVVGPIGLLMWLDIGTRFPMRDSARACTTRLDADGVQDTTPTGTKFIPWANVASVRLVRGDIHFLTRGGGGFYIPRSAFPGETQAREFADEATRLRKVANRAPAVRLAFESGGVQSAAPAGPAKATLTPAQQSGCHQLMLLPILLLALAGMVWGAVSWHTDFGRAAEFHRSPGCVPSAPAGPLPPCTSQTLTVTAVSTVNGGRSSEEHILSLQGPGAPKEQTVVVRRRLWERLSPGAPVRATLWRGQVIRVSAFGLTSRTENDPDDTLSSAEFLTSSGLTGLAFFSLMLWFSRREKPQAEASKGEG